MRLLTMFRFADLSLWAGWIVILLGGLTLVGWIFGVNILKTAFPGLISMKANTAVCLILAGISLLLQARPTVRVGRTRAGRFLAFVVVLISFLTLAEYAFDLDFGF